MELTTILAIAIAIAIAIASAAAVGLTLALGVAWAFAYRQQMRALDAQCKALYPPATSAQASAAFWDWLPRAYAEGDDNFTKYNMQAAYVAGWLRDTGKSASNTDGAAQ